MSFKPITPFVGAEVFIVNDKNEVCLTQREDNKLWCMPGGHQDLGETPVECAVRECREETGLEVEITGLVGVFSTLRCPDISGIHEDREYVDICFFGRVTGGKEHRSPEVVQIDWFGSDELPPLSDGHEKPVLHAFKMLGDSGSKAFFE